MLAPVIFKPCSKKSRSSGAGHVVSGRCRIAFETGFRASQSSARTPNQRPLVIVHKNLLATDEKLRIGAALLVSRADALQHSSIKNSTETQALIPKAEVGSCKVATDLNSLVQSLRCSVPRTRHRYLAKTPFLGSFQLTPQDSIVAAGG